MTKENLLKLIDESKKLTLLYVEDDEMILNNTIVILGRFFDNIVSAKNGKEGFERFKENKIDIIISDINMPFVSGIEMLEDIRKIDNDVPAILLTAHNEMKFHNEVERLNGSGYLLKPIKLDNLFELLSKIIIK